MLALELDYLGLNFDPSARYMVLHKLPDLSGPVSLLVKRLLGDLNENALKALHVVSDI